MKGRFVMGYPRGLNLVVLAGLAAALVAGSADAATKKKRVYVNGQPVEYVQSAPSAGTVIVTRGEDGRTRTKILVQKRSFLDGGTEVMPGERKFTDYVYPPGYRPAGALGDRYNVDRQPLNGMFDFGSSRY
jgi:hypothetical protein